jgi:hypothetical protein
MPCQESNLSRERKWQEDAHLFRAEYGRKMPIPYAKFSVNTLYISYIISHIALLNINIIAAINVHLLFYLF